MTPEARTLLSTYLRLRRRSEALEVPAYLEMDHNRDLSRMIHPYEPQSMVAQEAHQAAERATAEALAAYMAVRPPQRRRRSA
jgi:hypothetical protein